MTKNKKTYANFLFAGLILLMPSVGWSDLLGGVVNGAINATLGGGGGGDGGISTALCTIVYWFTDPGGIGSALASLSVVFLGIGAFFGKVTWGTAATFTAGIAAIFGANDIVGMVVPFASGC